MRIVHLVGDLSPASGGLTNAVAGLASAQSRQGDQVSVVSTDYQFDRSAFPEDLEVHLFHCFSKTWRWSPGFWRIFSHVAQSAYIVHVHSLWHYPILAGVQVCRHFGKPYVLSPHGMLDCWSMNQKNLKKRFYLASLGRSILRNAAAVHFTSERERERSALSGFSGKTFVCPLGLERSAYEKFPDVVAFRNRFPEIRSRRIVLSLSRLHYAKQPEVVIKAFGILAKTYPDSCLVIAGGGQRPYEERLKRLAALLGLNEQVIFTGPLHGVGVQEAYGAASVFVLPSLHENFGFSIMEAMAAGCPVVISENLDFSPQILKAHAGLLCPPNPESMAAALAALLGDENLRRRMGDNARQLVLENFTCEKAALRLTGLYRSILNDFART